MMTYQFYHAKDDETEVTFTSATYIFVLVDIILSTTKVVPIIPTIKDTVLCDQIQFQDQNRNSIYRLISLKRLQQQTVGLMQSQSFTSGAVGQLFD